MSVYWYDEAIVKKFREITGDDRVAIIGPEQVYRYAANQDKDDVVYPLITLKRTGYSTHINHRTKLSSEGFRKQSESSVETGVTTNDKGEVVKVQMIPMSINYTVDIIAKTRQENDMITDELLFYLTNNPTIQVKIGKGIDYVHNFNFFIDKNITDNSQIESFIAKMQFFRTTFSCTVPDAYMWKSTAKPIVEMKEVSLETQVEDHTEDKEIEVIVTSGSETGDET